MTTTCLHWRRSRALLMRPRRWRRVVERAGRAFAGILWDRRLSVRVHEARVCHTCFAGPRLASMLVAVASQAPGPWPHVPTAVIFLTNICKIRDNILWVSDAYKTCPRPGP